MDFVKLLKKRYPDYDPNHRRFNYGDLLLIDNHGIGIFCEHYVMTVECFILKSSFGLTVGKRCKVEYTRITDVIQNDLTNKIKWKSGNRVEDNGNEFVLLEKDGRYWIAICVSSVSKYVHPGECFCIFNPYEDYLMD